MLKLMPVPPTEKNGAVAEAAWPGPRTSGTGCEEPGIAIVSLNWSWNVLTRIVPWPDAVTEPVPTSWTVPLALNA